MRQTVQTTAGAQQQFAELAMFGRCEGTVVERDVVGTSSLCSFGEGNTEDPSPLTTFRRSPGAQVGRGADHGAL